MTTPENQAQTAAQRQRAYRQRRRRATFESIGHEDTASRVALLASLGYALATLDAAGQNRHHDASRNTAQRALRELVTRYAITLDD